MIIIVTKACLKKKSGTEERPESDQSEKTGPVRQSLSRNYNTSFRSKKF